MYSIRFFNATNDDYAAIVTIHHLASPDERQFTIDQWRESDDEWPATSLNQRFVAEYNNQIVGVGACYEKYWQHQSGTIHVEFYVHPDHVQQNVDQLLYDSIITFLRKQKPYPKIIATRAREDQIRRTEFLQKHDFEPTMRSPGASLSLSDFDKTRYQELYEKIEAQGVSIYTLLELYEREPNWKEKSHELRWAIIQDVPSVEPATYFSLAEFENMILDDPALDERGWFVAVDAANQFVGMSNLWINDPTHKRLDVGLTGVVRSYRRQGIATALKVRTIEFAQQLGANRIETENEEGNPMYALNLKLGFRPKPAWVSYHKQLKQQ